MLRFFRLFLGYVRIEIVGAYPHRFLNLCSHKGISVWGMDCSRNGNYQINLSVKEFFELKPIAKKSRMKVVLLEKRGLPFRLRRLKHRKGFIVGLLLCSACLFLMTRFIWDIRLVGGERLTQEMLLQFLKEEEIEYGCRIHGIDIDEAEKDLRDAFPYIVWTSFQVQGTRLVVQVKENTQNLEQAKKEQHELAASDLKATVDGTVESIITRQGMPQVCEGDEIHKGDKLVSGMVPIVNDDGTVRDYMQVISDADVWIRTKYPVKWEIPFRYQKKVYTGRTKTVWYLKVHDMSLVTARPPRYEKYDVETDLEQARLINDFYLPLYFGSICYKEYELDECVYTTDLAQKILRKEFMNFCESLQQKGIQIIGKDVRIKKNMDKLWMEGNVTVVVRDGDPAPVQNP